MSAGKRVDSPLHSTTELLGCPAVSPPHLHGSESLLTVDCGRPSSAPLLPRLSLALVPLHHPCPQKCHVSEQASVPMSHHFIILLNRLERRPSFIWGSVGQWCGLFQPEIHPCEAPTPVGRVPQTRMLRAWMCVVLVSGALLLWWGCF